MHGSIIPDSLTECHVKVIVEGEIASETTIDIGGTVLGPLLF